MSSLPTPSPSLIQPISAGILATVVGFASSVTILLAGFTAVGASPAEAASGLFAVSFIMGALSIGFAVVTRTPITIAWSTPGAALLLATGAPAGGYAVAVGAFLIAGALVVLAGVFKPFGRAVSAIPLPLAGAMLAGVLLPLCLAPVRAVGAMPMLALPIIVAWALALRFARPYAVPIAVVVTAIMVIASTSMPPGTLDHLLPAPVFIVPAFTLQAIFGIAVPLFIVTMASQNVPGLAVLAVYGYRPAVGPIFMVTGLGSMVTALMGGHAVNLAAITAALNASPEAHPDPARRWIATTAGGVVAILLGCAASFATAFVIASPPLLIEAVAGLALLTALSATLSSALANEEDRLPSIVTFITAASGVSFFGIGAAFWGLVAGGALMALLRWQKGAT